MSTIGNASERDPRAVSAEFAAEAQSTPAALGAPPRRAAARLEPAGLAVEHGDGTRARSLPPSGPRMVSSYLDEVGA
jgi:hypothetical protein